MNHPRVVPLQPLFDVLALADVVAASRSLENVNVGHGQSWWARRDLNPRPRDYESPALTAELQARFEWKFEMKALEMLFASTEWGISNPQPTPVSRGSAFAINANSCRRRLNAYAQIAR